MVRNILLIGTQDGMIWMGSVIVILICIIMTMISFEIAIVALMATVSMGMIGILDLEGAIMMNILMMTTTIGLGHHIKAENAKVVRENMNTAVIVMILITIEVVEETVIGDDVGLVTKNVIEEL